jgi:hypothetical protein
MMRTRITSRLGIVALALASASAPAAVKTWTGAVDLSWIENGNWSPTGAPTSGDDAKHLNSDDITMDAGSFGSPSQINSFKFDATAGGSLTFGAGKGLDVASSFDPNNPAHTALYPITLNGHSTLIVGGNLSRVDATLVATTNGNETVVTVTGDVLDSTFEVNDYCEVHVAGGIVTTDSTGDDWTVTSGTIEALDTCVPAGNWVLTDAAMTLGYWEAADNVPITLTLTGSSTIEVFEAPYNVGTTFESDENNALLYGEGDNLFLLGASSTDTPTLTIGKHTYIGRAAGDPGSLELNIFGAPAPESRFVFSVVRENWDTRDVDVVIGPITTGDYYGGAFIDPISSNVTAAGGGAGLSGHALHGRLSRPDA